MKHTHHPKLNPPVSSRDHTQGPETAPVTLVMYGDYECPYTALSHSFLREVRKELGDDVRLVYRYFPLTDIHPHAQVAAELAQAAAAQHRFWEMHHQLMTHHDALEDPDLLRYAEKAGLNLERLAQDLQDPVTSQRVLEDRRGGDGCGVTGTPTFFINGERFAPKFDLQGLAEALVAQLRPA